MSKAQSRLMYLTIFKASFTVQQVLISGLTHLLEDFYVQPQEKPITR